MDRFGAVVFSLLLLAPLAAAPGFGDDALRLPAVLALVTLLLAATALRAVRRRDSSSRSDPLLTAALLFLGANVLSLAAAPSAWEAAPPLALLAAGVAVYAFARGGSLPLSYALDTGPWVWAGLGLALAAVGFVQVALGYPAVLAEGNANYSGTLAGMLLPVTASAALAGPRGRRVFSASAAAGLFLLLLAAGSRGGLVGAVAGCAVAGTVLVRRRVPRAGPAVAAALVLLVAVPLLLSGRRHFSAARAETATVRIGIWKGAAAMFANRPWLGAGAGGFAVRFPPYRDAEEFAISNRDAWPDFKEVEDAHSSWVQVAAETGVPGLLTFLLVLYVAARLWRFYAKEAPDADRAAVLAGLGGGVAAYLAAGLFNTLTARVSHTVLFWAFLGLIELAGHARVRRRLGPARQSAVAVPLAAALAALLAAGMAGTLAWMDFQFHAGMRTASAPERAARFEKALRVYPHFWTMRYELARAHAAMGDFLRSAAAYREVLEARPHQVAALNNAAVALLRTSGGEAEAERRLRHAIDVAPCFYLSHYNLGILEARRGRLPEARALLAEALRRNPRHARSSYSLGVTYLLEGETDRALEHFGRARESGFDVAEALREEHPAAATDSRFESLFR